MEPQAISERRSLGASLFCACEPGKMGRGLGERGEVIVNDAATGPGPSPQPSPRKREVGTHKTCRLGLTRAGQAGQMLRIPATQSL